MKNFEMPPLAFPMHFTPLERERLTRLVRQLADDERVERVVAFVIRRPGRSPRGGDLDLVVFIDAPRDREIEHWVWSAAARIESGEHGAPIQVMPMFHGDPPGRLRWAVAREGALLWKRG